MSSRGPRGRVIGSKTGIIRQSPQKTKKKTKKRAEWDDTVSDLSVHKASAAEMARRQMVALSQNLEQVRQERLQKRIRKARSQSRTPTRKTYLTKEVLYDSSQLEDVLAKSDRAMAVVKDMFGDNPQKYRGVPNVTVAPMPTREGLIAALSRSLVDDSTLGPTKLDVLSESVMNKTALNDMRTQEEDTDSDELEYEPQIDVERFKKLLALAEIEASKAKAEEQRVANRANRGNPNNRAASKQEPARRAYRRPDLQTPPDSLVGSPQVITAINDTGKCKKSMARTSQGRGEEEEEREEVEEATAPEETVEITNLEDLGKVLDGLENNIADYEKMTGREPAAQRLHSNTFSGYTVGLIDAVTRMTTYLRESELRLQAESMMREHLSEDVTQMRSLVDALTSDIIATQEEYAKLQGEFTRFRRDTSQQLATVKQSLEAYGIGHAPVAVPARYPPLPQSHPYSQPHTQIIYPKPQRPSNGHCTEPNMPSSDQHAGHRQFVEQHYYEGQKVEQSQQIGQHPDVGQGHYVGQNRNAGQSSTAGQDSYEGQNPNVGQSQHIGQRAEVGQNQYVGQGPNVGQNQYIGQNQAPMKGGHYMGRGDDGWRVKESRTGGESAQSHAGPSGDYSRMPVEVPVHQRGSYQQQSIQEPSGQELGDQMTAALSDALRRQEEDQDAKRQAYLLTPPRQTDSTRAGSQKQSVPVVPQNSSATRALQFHQDPQQPPPSAFAAYPKQQGKREGSQPEVHKPVARVAEGRDPLTGLDEEGKTLLEQIAELNRAHEEAHRKLSQLQTSHTQPTVPPNGKKTMKQQPGVSPSISPISFADSTAQSTQQFPKQNNVMSRPAREIRVALPRMDT